MIRITLFLIVSLVFLIHPQSNEIKVNNFLVYGPHAVVAPAVTGANDPDIKTLFSDGDNISPVISLLDERDLWDVLPAVFPEKSSREKNAFYYAVFMIRTTGFISTEMKVSSRLPYRVYIGSEGQKSNIDPVDADTTTTRSVTVPLKLETGKHLIVIKLLTLAKATGDRELKVTIKQPEDSKATLEVTTDPTTYTSFDRLLDDPKIQSVALSKDGNYASVSLSTRSTTRGSFDRKTIIFETSTGKTVKELQVSGFEWTGGDNYAYTISGNKKTTHVTGSAGSGETETVLDGIENFSGSTFSHDGSKLIYSVTKEVAEFDGGMKRHQGIQDRWPGNRTKTKTLLFDRKTGSTSVVVNYDDNLNFNDISSDNSKLLLTRSDYDLKTRPYAYTDHFIYDLKTGRLDSLFRGFYSGNVVFSKDGKSLLVTGGPSLFGETGITTPPELIPNEYNSLLYRYDIAGRKAECLTRDFDPAVSSFFEDEKNGSIYLLTTDKSYFNLWVRDSEGKFSKMSSPVKSIERIDIAPDQEVALIYGSDPDYPGRAFLLNLNKGTSKLLLDPNEKSYKNIKRGKYEEFTFTSDEGRTIEGAVFFPPDYDPSKKYPCIVNYYGGTTPVSNTFEGRYPKNIWTANGYVVFILQPSGAIGYGQKFSAYHVNDWGTSVAREIIKGTEEMLKRYPSVDREKLGCIGASYGGFMTMSLVTKTDLFAAAISHAGISSLSSYWGEGFWGLVYSAVATANSFPWNRKDIYIDKSPLFSADKVNTPLLLLHGNEDTNVPPGESVQFYTALKLLGKEVEFIEVDKQDHHILDYDKRKKWSKTIIAWFDKYLKGDTAWWNDLYPAN